MTFEATIAREVALQFECKLDALRRNQDGTVKLTLTINPSDFPRQLMTDDMGQRYVAVMVAVNEDETPKVNGAAKTASHRAEPEAAPLPPAPPSFDAVQMAGIMANDPEFHEYLEADHKPTWYKLLADEGFARDAAAQYIRDFCGVDSRRHITKSDVATQLFKNMKRSFEIWRDINKRGLEVRS